MENVTSSFCSTEIYSPTVPFTNGLARLDDLPVLMTATVLRDVVLHDDDFEDFLDLQATILLGFCWILKSKQSKP